jgi:hypothetical protein
VEPQVDGTEFYSFAAGIIPVLFLTLAFQQRSTRGFLSNDVATALQIQPSRGMDLFRAWYTLVVTLILASGEAAAIIGLIHHAPLKFSGGYIGSLLIGTLLAGGFGVVAPTLMIQLDTIFPDTGVSPLTRTFILLMLGAFCCCFIGFFIWALLH